jgi:hypothetical protein
MRAAAARELVHTESVGRGAKVSLLRWLRRQLRERSPLRERLEAAIDNDDSSEARRIIARYDLSAMQRHHLDNLLAEWEHDLPPGGGRKVEKRDGR